ncbi:MAG: hypothetical protein H7Y07_02745 [Pyrinomonadaceae bacterium]|nr:hypothetical protein [Sphingobacteriaceae bacterium]
MKLYLPIYILIAVCGLIGCNKDTGFTNDPSVKLQFSKDSILFDTVFTSMGSITQRLKVFNPANKPVKIGQINLGGGSLSSYQINVNGIPSSQFTSVEIGAKDSLNLFVKVSINPNSTQLPFIVKDSISFLTNGNLQKVILRAYGQNAHFLKDAMLNENTVWDDKIPYVIYNSVMIAPEKTLTIKKGTKILFHKDSEMIIAGTLKVEGALNDSVLFASDRLERIYADESGQWKGLRFLASSKNNAINYAHLKNAIIGIQIDSLSKNANPKVLLTNTVIKNMEVAGVYSSNSEIEAFNNVITNCGKYLLYAVNGGKYNFKQNTLANHTLSFPRNTPAVFFSDASPLSTTPVLSIQLVNNIIWGNLQEELMIEKKGTVTYSASIKNNLIKTKAMGLDQSNLINADPLFKNTKNYDFLLKPGSPALNKGADLSADPGFNLWLNKDLKGRQRLFPSDLGSYEIL